MAAIRAKGESETELGAGATGTVVVPPQPVVYQARVEGAFQDSWANWDRSTDGFFQFFQRRISYLLGGCKHDQICCFFTQAS